MVPTCQSTTQLFFAFFRLSETTSLDFYLISHPPLPHNRIQRRGEASWKITAARTLPVAAAALSSTSAPHLLAHGCSTALPQASTASFAPVKDQSSRLAGRHRSRQHVQATLISRLILVGRGQRLLRRPFRSAGTAKISSMSGAHDQASFFWLPMALEAMTVDPNDGGMESYARDLLFGQVAVAMEVECQALSKDGGGHRFFPFCSV